MLATELENHQGRRLRVARVGSGPPLVLLHGYPDNLQLFCELARHLSQRFTVIAFDWPGMGASDGGPGGTTPQHMADHLRDLLDAWGLARAAVLGVDMGGQPALVLAARHPERVERLCVMNSLVMPARDTSWEIRLLRRYRFNQGLIRWLPRLVFLRAERTSLPQGVRLPRELRADLWGAFRRPEVRRFISRMCGGYQGSLPRLPELYPTIRCPTLVLWGERDRHFPPVHARDLQRAIPGSRLALVPGGEHWMAWHAAAEVASPLLGWG